MKGEKLPDKVKERVFRYIDERKDDMVEFLCKYIKLKPINPGSGKGKELKAQNWIRNQFKKIGFDEVDYWYPFNSKERPNVVGRIKGMETNEKKSLIFNGHTDVVTVPEAQFPKWTVDPWNPTVKKGVIYGRGASDMLGGNTAMIWAARSLIDSGVKFKNDLIVECVVGEESNEGGTTSAIERGYRAPFAIVAEPSNCEIHPISCGFFMFEMTVPGKEVHTGLKNLTLYPQRCGISSGSEIGVDAISKTIKLLSAFQELERNWGFRWKHPLLGGGGWPLPMDQQGVGVFTITPTLIEGGSYFASLAGYCKVTCQVHYPAWVTEKEAWSEVKGAVDAVSLTDDWLKKHPPTLKIVRSVGPSKVSANHRGCKALANAWRGVSGKEAIFSGFKCVCDASYFCKEGIPAVIFGPGDFLTGGVHGVDEHISIRSMILCAKTYAGMAIDWCGL